MKINLSSIILPLWKATMVKRPSSQIFWFILHWIISKNFARLLQFIFICFSAVLQIVGGKFFLFRWLDLGRGLLEVTFLNSNKLEREGGEVLYIFTTIVLLVLILLVAC